MEIFQGSISTDYSCRPLVKNKKHVGLLFFKKDSTTNNALLSIAITIGILSSIYIWYKSNFETFLVVAFLFFSAFITYTLLARNKSEEEGIKYLINEIKEVKVIDNETMSSFKKNGASTLTGAAVGGLLFGGAGAVVGSIASGNKNLKEQIVRVGVKFEDGNWVVLQTEINETIMGKVNKENLKILLEMTTSKQLAPF